LVVVLEVGENSVGSTIGDARSAPSSSTYGSPFHSFHARLNKPPLSKFTICSQFRSERQTVTSIHASATITPSGNSRPVEAVTESGDMVGENDEVEDVNEDALGC
jgi:hypothetical protein